MIALDVGTHEFRSLQVGGGRLIARRNRAAYSILEDTEANRGLLRQIGVTFAECEDQLLVFGNDAEKLAQLLRVPCRSLFPNGEFPSEDPPVRQMIAALMESVVGRAAESGELCAVTLPGCMKSGDDAGHRQRDFVTQLLRLQGFQSLELSAPRALVLAELGGDAFTGIGLNFGAGSSQAGLVHRGNLLAQCCVPYAGNWIDLRLARGQQAYFWDAQGRKFLNVQETEAWKKSFSGSLREPASTREQQFADLHRGMVEFLLREAAMRFRPAMERFAISRPLPMVVAGGTARVPGFRDLVRDVLPTVSFSVPITDVRLAVENDFTIARGGLILAELERDQRRFTAEAA